LGRFAAQHDFGGNVTESTDLVAVEQPQQLITIEPAEYVAQVFEPFAKRLADAKQLALSTTYDVKTTAGMAMAVKIRATFRDIRVESEKARKIRKAPILEIGKLLDSRQKEIESEIEPFESEPDLAIKAEEARKEAERQAKLAAEAARIAFIRKRIGEIQAIPSESVGRSAADLAATIELTEMMEITLAEFMELSGECEVVKSIALGKLREMHAAQLAAEEAAAEAARRAEAERIERAAEAQRLAVERAQLAKEREEAAERERQAAAERQRIADEERVARAKAQAVELARQKAEQKKLDDQRHEVEQQRAAQQAAADKMNAAMSEIQGIQQQVIIAQSGRLGVRKGGTIECLRETLAETEAWEIDAERFGILAGSAESAKTTAVAEIRRLLVEAEAKEREDAEARRQREEAERAAAIEAQRVAEAEAAEAARAKAEKEAAEREQIRRVRVQFEKNGPGDEAIVARLADIFDVKPLVVVGWLEKFNAAAFKSPEEKAA
jgi:hypothetical protein